MRTIGIDPGCEQSAWCIVRDGTPEASAKEPNEAIVRNIREGKIWPFVADLIGIEMIASYGMAVGKEVFETVRWIGRFQEVLESRGATVRLVYRREVKLFLCESVRATDANIRAALIDRYGPGREKAIGIKRAPGPLYDLKGDQWSALAVALTAEALSAPSAQFMRPRAVTIGDTPAEKVPF